MQEKKKKKQQLKPEKNHRLQEFSCQPLEKPDNLVYYPAKKSH